MSVQELSVLHRRYVEVSDRFRSAWSFHKFLGSLSKVLMNGESRPLPLDFQSVYSELKEISHHLNVSGVDLVKAKLDQAGEQLGGLNKALLAEDSRIAPSAVRKFFRRVKNPDEKVLTQLAKFYLATYPADWNHDRLDKFDFLLTHLAAESEIGGGAKDSRERFREVLGGLSQMADVTADVEDRQHRVDDWLAEIQDIRQEIRTVEDLDEFHERRIIPRYREAKRRLGPLFFDPHLLLKVVTTNLAFGERISDLYEKEEREVARVCREVFSLEEQVPMAGGADGSLDADLNRFRREFDRFEREVQGGELKLDRLAQIRYQARSLAPRLRSSLGEGGDSDAETSEVPLEQEASFAADPRGNLDHLRGYAQDSNNESLRRILDALAGTSSKVDPAEVITQPEIFPLRLEAREVEAYRRFDGSDLTADLNLERFLIEAAALRVRLNAKAEEIRAILDETATSGEGPTFEAARQMTRRADSFLRHFGHLIEGAVLEDRQSDARSLQLLRMRLMRVYSGLWLLAFRPSRYRTRR